jgi:hypothetical protein
MAVNVARLPGLLGSRLRVNRARGSAGSATRRDDLTAQIPGLTGEQIGSLEMLADFPHGCTEGQGFTIALLGGLIRRTRDRDTGDREGRRPVARRGEIGDHGEGADNRPMT